MKINSFFQLSVLALATCLILSCSNNKTVKDTRTPEQIKSDSIKDAAVAAAKAKLEKLLAHFKDNNTFPLTIDSAYIANSVIKHDSLGENEIKAITVQWNNDSLMSEDHDAIKDFYRIDSLKANHGFEKYSEKLDIGDIRYSNAYGLQKVQLADSTQVLIWALAYASYQADPMFNSTSIYGTMLNKGNMGITFLLGQSTFGADPPAQGTNILTSNLMKDGKLVMDSKLITEDLDSMTSVTNKSHFEYAISNGKVNLKIKKRSPPKQDSIRIGTGK